MQDLSLSLHALELSFAGMNVRGDERPEGVGVHQFGPRQGIGWFEDIELSFEPLKPLLEQSQTALDGRRLLPLRLTLQRRERGDALRKAPQIRHECGCELSEGQAPRP